MAVVNRAFAFTIMALILLFSLIHLAVSVGIIVPYRKYGDMFRPQIGLSSFNLAICFFGLVTGILGMVATCLKSDLIARAVCGISAFLGVLALASLVTAIILNAKAANYVSPHFSNNLIAYQNSAGSRNIIDLLQYKYSCCGTDMWIDWTRADLNGTSSMTNATVGSTTTLTTTTSTTTTTATTTTSTTTTTVTTTSSTSTITTTTISMTISTTTMTLSSTTTTQASNGSIVKRDTSHTLNGLRRRQVLQLADYPRKKRQATLDYGDIEGLPITFGVILPGSCCSPTGVLTSNASGAYCVSNYNGTANSFYTEGCAKPIHITASNQLMGIAVINSFMIVLAFVGIPAVLGFPAGTI